jgi:hypothetical protein
LVISTLSSEMHRPSAEKLWHMPQDAALPRPLGPDFLLTPLEVHDTSYFAASVSIRSFSLVSIAPNSSRLS